MAERKLTIRMNADTKNLQRGMATASASTQSFGKSIQSGITRHAAGIRMTGLAIAGVGVAMTAMVALSVKAAMSFEKELANVSTMLDDIGMNLMPTYAEGLREMSKEFGESTETLSKGLYDILSASIDSSKAMDVLAVSAKLAAAGLTDTGIAADAITTIINSYAMAAEDAGKISDWMFSVVKRGKLTMAELAPSVGKVAATASIAGVSLEELGASIATITRAGIRSQEAMTAINGILRAFLKPTDDAAKAARDFGFELNTNTLRTIGFRGVLELLSEATAEQVAAMFPNIRGLKGVAAAMKDAEGFTKDYALMLNSAGMTQEAFDKQTSTLAFTMEQLKQEFADIFREIGTALIPIIKSEFIPLIKDVIEFLKGWVERFKALSPEMRKFLLVLGPILIALGGLIALLPTLVVALPALAAGFTAVAFSLGPIGLIIAGLSAAFLYFYKTSPKFRATIQNIGEVIKVVFINIMNYTNWFKNNFVALWVTMAVGIGQIMENLRYNIWEIIKGLGERIMGWGSWLYKNFLNVWRNLFTAIGTAAVNFGENIWAQMKWLGEKLKPKNWLKKIEKPEWKPLFEEFEAIWEELPEFAEIQLKSLLENVKNYMEPLPELVKPVWAAIEDGAKGAGDAIDRLGDKIDELAKRLERIRDVVILVGKKLTKSFDDFKDVAIPATVSVTDAIVVFLKKLEGVWGAIEKIPPALAKIKDVDVLGNINDAFLYLAYLLKPIPEAIKKTSRALEQVKDVKALGDINEALLLLAYLLKPLPKAIEKIPRALKRIKNVEALGDINEALLLLAYLLKPLPPAIEKIPRALEQIKDVEAIGNINNAFLYLAYLLKPLPPAIEEIRLNLERIKDVEAIGDINDAFLIMAYLLKPIPEAIKPVARGLREIGDEVEVLGDINDAFLYLAYLLKPIPEAIKKIPRALEKARDVTIAVIEDMRSNWQKLWDAIGEGINKVAEIIKAVWESIWEDIARVAFDSFADIIGGVKTMEEAFLDFAEKLQTVIADALLNMALQAAAAGDAVGAVVLGLAALIASVFDKIWDWFTGAAERARELEEALEKIGQTTSRLGEAFKDVGISLTRSIQDAERAIRNLIQSQEDLQTNTRDKLIKELDNYYDYRVLKEMDLTELLALSAETREKLEKGTLEEIAETAEETAEREKDAKVGTLQAIEEAYAKESALIDKKIALLKIEILLLMAAAEAEAGNLEKARKLRNEANKALWELLHTEEELAEQERERTMWREGREKESWNILRDATKDATDAAKKYGVQGEAAARITKEGLKGVIDELKKTQDETDEARYGIEDWGEDGRRNAQKITEGFKEARIEIDLWGQEISKLPSRIDFDIVGNLRMPDIPQIGDQFFSIWGQYRAPKIPSFRTGGQTFQKGGISEPGELVLNKPITDWIRRAMSRPGPTGYIPSTGGSNIPSATDRMARRGEITERRIIVEQHVEIKSLIPPDDPIIYRRLWREGMRKAYEEDRDRRTE